MNPIGTILDVLVLALLAWALALGLTLNRRLKALRDGQADFAKAVGELNDAAGRAQAGLAELRGGAEETLGLLQGRIEVARGLLGELERAAARCSPVTRFASESPPASLEGDNTTATRPSRRLDADGLRRPPSEAGQLSPAQRTTGGQATPPAGFAEMIRRTLREAR